MPEGEEAQGACAHRIRSEGGELGAEEASGAQVSGEGQVCGDKSGGEKGKEAGQRGPLLAPSVPLQPPAAGTGAMGFGCSSVVIVGKMLLIKS